MVSLVTVALLMLGFILFIFIILVNDREIWKYPPSKTVALVGLYDNIIIHSVNNILILLSMINGVNVKNNRYVVM